MYLPSFLLPLFAILAFSAPTPEDTTEEVSVDAIPATPVVIGAHFPSYLNKLRETSKDAPVCTGYTGTVSWSGWGTTDEVRLLVGFDVPSWAGENCWIKFQMPYPKNPYGYQWELIGPGPSVSIDVWPLQSPFVNCEVSWNRRPARAGTGAAFRIVQPKVGGYPTITGGPIACKKGQRMDFELAITRDVPGYIDWFELDNPVTGILLQTTRG